MRISIDTKEDSPEDIRRVISLLEHLLSTGSSAPKDIFANAQAASPSPPPSSGGLFDLFSSSAPAPASAAEPAPQPATPNEENTDDIRIIPYD
ncbi:MAG TPA: hypothetical protein VJC16_07810 [Candidatus Nanoarchaeia archaeon]|nr:hypothetical protein [Candidatus Nanoarchaeia archaeon]